MNNTQEVVAVRMGEDWGGCIKNLNTQTHRSLQPCSKGKACLNLP